MKRTSFIKSVIGLFVAPSIISEINANAVTPLLSETTGVDFLVLEWATPDKRAITSFTYSRCIDSKRPVSTSIKTLRILDKGQYKRVVVPDDYSLADYFGFK